MGKSASPPPAPDYTAAAKQQGVDNIAAAKQSTMMSNPNMYTPFGNQTVTYSQPTFDETGYNSALSKYNAANPAVDRNQYYRGGTAGGGGESTSMSPDTFDQSGYNAALAAAKGAAPDRSAFTTAGGVPTVTQTLTPHAQATLDSQMRVQQRLAALGETAMGNVNNTLSTPFTPTTSDIQHNFADYGRAQNTFADNGRAMGEVPLTTKIDTSNMVGMPVNAGTNSTQLMLERLNPTITAGDTSFRQQLANQGLAPGTAAYDTAFRNREMSKNDLYNTAAQTGITLDLNARQQAVNEALGIGGFQNQAQLSKAGLYNSALGQDFNQDVTRGQFYNQGINQDYNQALQRAQFQNTAQQQQLAQDMALRSQPLNELASIMGGSQIQLPQFGGYQGTQVAPAPTFGAVQAQQQNAMQNFGIQQAGNNATTQGITSLAMAGAMAY